MKLTYWLLFGCLIGGLSACNSGNYYQKYEDIKLFDWRKSIPQVFQVDIKEDAPKLAIVAAFRYMPMIRHQALKFKLLIKSPSGKETAQDYTLAIRDKKGDHLGSTMGEMTDFEKEIESSFAFAEKGTYTFTITQAMDEDDVAGVMEVGLILRKK
jgi:gliding motility-associated lipoprotein GldH